MNPSRYILDIAIFVVVAVVVFLIVAIIWEVVLSQQFSVYDVALTHSINTGNYVLFDTAMRLRNFMTVKIISLLISFLGILIGSLYVFLVGRRIDFSAIAKTPQWLAAVKSTSPGVIIVICGTVLGVFSVLMNPDSYYATEPRRVQPTGETKQIYSPEE